MSKNGKKERAKAEKDAENGNFEPPKSLKEAGRRLWRDSLSGWDVQPEQFSLLKNLCESQDRIAELTETLRSEGQVVADRFGQLHPHPAAIVPESILQTCVAPFLTSIDAATIAPYRARRLAIFTRARRRVWRDQVRKYQPAIRTHPGQIVRVHPRQLI